MKVDSKILIPVSIDDSLARQDWGWNHAFDLKMLTQSMLKKLTV
tara:strand:- start:79 stop:210 length:132 start_codon:yes stop_codon:yes gene_type:complete